MGFTYYLNSREEKLEQKRIAKLKDKIRTYSKTANQRLRELEKQNLQKGSVAYQFVLRDEYDNKSYISHTGKGEVKFVTALTGKTEKELNEELASLEKFLNASTSTRTGIKQVMERQYNQYKEKTGTNPTFEDFSAIYSSASVQNLLSIYGSDTIVRLQKRFGEKAITKDNIEDIISKISYIDENGNRQLGISENNISRKKHLDELNSFKTLTTEIESYLKV